ALIANYMNVGSGGKQPIIRDTIFNGQIRIINFSGNYLNSSSLCGKSKGMRQILYECNLLTLNLKGLCQNKNSEENNCCMKNILEKQPDFVAQKCLIQEPIEVKGHKIIFYPKFHYELNYIGSKDTYCNYLQELQLVATNCDYTWKDAYKNGLNAKQAIKKNIKDIMHVFVVFVYYLINNKVEFGFKDCNGDLTSMKYALCVIIKYKTTEIFPN
ncbi:23741_t:CDS:2, partial [Dentiscutata erythropus]